MYSKNITEQLKNDFQFTLSRLSHELRNPLSLISSSLQMMASSHPEVEDYEQWDDILDNMNYICDLLNELSVFNHSEQISPQLTDPVKYLRTILSSIQPTLDYLNIQLEINISNNLPVINLDPVRIRQALLNILKNAWEALPARGIISVNAVPFNSGICISIKDNGCGISPEQQKKIFQPFFTTKTEGTGLGLAITRQIIEAHHGRITVESTPDHGTTFYIFLG